MAKIVEINFVGDENSNEIPITCEWYRVMTDTFFHPAVQNQPEIWF